MSFLPAKLSSTVGIEMEFNCTAAIENHIGDDEALGLPSNWGSKDEHVGIEIVMNRPRKTGSAIERNVEALCEWANENTTGVFNCGVHVHMGMPPNKVELVSGAYGEAIRALSLNYAKFLVKNERFFMYLVPLHRALGYNPPWTQEVSLKLMQEAGSRVTTPSQLYSSSTHPIPRWLYPTVPRNVGHRNDTSPSSSGWVSTMPPSCTEDGRIQRNLSGNRRWVTGITRHNTVEYRILEGTRDPKRVVGWVGFLDFIHKKALRDELPPEALSTLEDTRQQVMAKTIDHLTPPTHIKNWLEEQYANNDFSHHVTACR